MKASHAAGVVLAGVAGLMLILAFRSFRLYAELRRHSADSAALRDVALLAGALVAVSALIMAASRLRAPLRINLALALASCALVLYLFEGLQALDNRLGRRFAEKISIIESLNREGKNAYGGVEPARFNWWWLNGSPRSVMVEGREILPLSGVSRKLTVDCKEVDEQPWLIFVSDEHGFNNPPGLWARAPVELAAVGDSFTAGSCVPPEQNLVGWLRRRYASALNLGMAGSGPLIMLAELLEYARLARPRIVLWCHFGGNDLRDLRREFRHPILVRYLDGAFRQGLPEQQAAVDAALEEYEESWLSKRPADLARRTVKLADFLALRATRARLGLGFSEPDTFAPTEREFTSFEAILAKARAAVAAWDGQIYFVYLPDWSGPPRQIGARAIESLEDETRRRVLSIARRLSLTVVDLADTFASHPDSASLFACPGCHYSAEGYRLAAESVLAALESAGVAPQLPPRNALSAGQP